jgi:hypothetical protein
MDVQARYLRLVRQRLWRRSPLPCAPPYQQVRFRHSPQGIMIDQSAKYRVCLYQKWIQIQRFGVFFCLVSLASWLLFCCSKQIHTYIHTYVLHIHTYVLYAEVHAHAHAYRWCPLDQTAEALRRLNISKICLHVLKSTVLLTHVDAHAAFGLHC